MVKYNIMTHRIEQELTEQEYAALTDAVGMYRSLIGVHLTGSEATTFHQTVDALEAKIGESTPVEQ